MSASTELFKCWLMPISDSIPLKVGRSQGSLCYMSCCARLGVCRGSHTSWGFTRRNHQLTWSQLRFAMKTHTETLKMMSERQMSPRRYFKGDIWYTHGGLMAEYWCGGVVGELRILSVSGRSGWKSWGVKPHIVSEGQSCQFGSRREAVLYAANVRRLEISLLPCFNHVFPWT